MRGDPLSLYVHIPFCSLKCAYCDFNSYARLEELVPSFCDALLREIGAWGAVTEDRAVRTIFFGGGTPSLLPVEQNERLLNGIRASFAVAEDAEVTIEANPGTVDPTYLSRLRDSGFNRISFGVQSFRRADLDFLDRIHTAIDAADCVRWTRNAGFERVSLDLIYGLPGQSLDSWEENVRQALALDPGHLSLYALTVEDGTRLAYDVGRGLVEAPDPDVQAEMYESACNLLAHSGYEQYEISNWARPGHQCRHNLVYWRNCEWLGLGPGAHSHWQGYRFANVSSPRRYIDLVPGPISRSAGCPTLALEVMHQVAWVEPQSRTAARSDSAILALRLNEGLDRSAFAKRFGRAFEEQYPAAYAEMTNASLLVSANDRLRLTARGRLLANEVFVRLLPD